MWVQIPQGLLLEGGMVFKQFFGNANDVILIDPTRVLAISTDKDNGQLCYVYLEGRQSYTVQGTMQEVASTLGITYA